MIETDLLHLAISLSADVRLLPRFCIQEKWHPAHASGGKSPAAVFIMCANVLEGTSLANESAVLHFRLRL